jgi:hypothetical protein
MGNSVDEDDIVRHPPFGDFAFHEFQNILARRLLPESAYETFVTESKKISELYTDFAKQTFKPFEGLIAKMTLAK